mmetsp:Transcript_25575/g.65866  ORF Transcript_25575/g.65866 Transcript_25575/m.65866 type:complete len:295 (-) Transcript_25575:1247-2131(-)
MQLLLQMLLEQHTLLQVLQQGACTLQLAALRTPRGVSHHSVEHGVDSCRRVWDVLLQRLLAVALLPGRLHPRDLGLELEGALRYRLLAGAHHFVDVVADVLLSRALEWDLGGDDAHKHAHFVAVLIDLVRRPVYALARSLGDHVRSAFKQQRNAVGVPEDVDSGFHVLAAEAHSRFDDESMPLEHLRLALVSGHHVWAALLHDAQPQVVLPGWAQVLAVRIAEARLVQQLVHAHDLPLVQLARGGLDAHPAAHLLDQPGCVGLADLAELVCQKVLQVGILGDGNEALDKLEVHG